MHGIFLTNLECNQVSCHLALAAICILALISRDNVEWYTKHYAVMALFFRAPRLNLLVLLVQLAQVCFPFRAQIP